MFLMLTRDTSTSQGSRYTLKHSKIALNNNSLKYILWVKYSPGFQSDIMAAVIIIVLSMDDSLVYNQLVNICFSCLPQ